MWCIPKLTEEYVERMMDILEVYERPYNPKFPVICFDEKSKQLLEDVRPSVNTKPGIIRKTDYEYKRCGTVNLFVSVEPKAGRRKVTVTKKRKSPDFAKEIKRLAAIDYKDADKLVLVIDNLSTHSKKAIIDEFGEEEAQKILDRIEWHYTPVHASWLNQAEIEISVLEKQCLKKRIGTFQMMQSHTAAWARDRNRKEARINWSFTRKKAEKKFKLRPNNN